MSISDSYITRKIDDIERAISALETSITNLASKKQLVSYTNIRQNEVLNLETKLADLQQQLTNLKASSGGPVISYATADQLSAEATTRAQTDTGLQNQISSLSIPAGAIDLPKDIAGTAAIGTGTHYARNDHIHSHGQQLLGDGTDHAAATHDFAGFLPAADKQKLDWLSVTGSNEIEISPPGSTFLFNNTIVRAYQFNVNNRTLLSGDSNDQVAINGISGGNRYANFDVSSPLALAIRDINGSPMATTIGQLTSIGFKSTSGHGILDTGNDGVEIQVFNSPRWLFRDIAGGFYSIYNASALAFDRTGAQIPTTQVNEVGDGVLAIQHVSTGSPLGGLNVNTLTAQELVGTDNAGNILSTVQPYAWSTNPAAFQGIRIDGHTSGLGVALFAVDNGVLYAWDPVNGASGGFRSDNFSNGAGSFSVDISGNTKVSTMKLGGSGSIAISESPANVLQVTLADLSTLIPIRTKYALESEPEQILVFTNAGLIDTSGAPASIENSTRPTRIFFNFNLNAHTSCSIPAGLPYGKRISIENDGGGSLTSVGIKFDSTESCNDGLQWSGGGGYLYYTSLGGGSCVEIMKHNKVGSNFLSWVVVGGRGQSVTLDGTGP